MPLKGKVKELWLPGIKLVEIERFIDERGMFHELRRSDWRELLGDDTIVQVDMSITYPGIIRAWHRHLRGQVDYLFIARGSAKICAYDEAIEAISDRVGTWFQGAWNTAWVLHVWGFHEAKLDSNAVRRRLPYMEKILEATKKIVA